MSLGVIGVGAVANDGTGDPLRTAFQTANANFAAMWNAKTSLGGVALPGATLRAWTVDTVGAGNLDVYTVPASKCLYVLGYSFYNPTAGGIAAYLAAKSGGAYYRLMSSLTPAAGGQSGANFNAGAVGPFVFAATETLAVNAAALGLRCTVRAIEFDAGVVVPARIFGPSAGDNTLYTCPAGKTAILLGGSLHAGTGAVNVSNDSGGTRTWQMYRVPSGGSPGAGNKVSASVAPTTGTASGFSTPVGLDAGDAVVLNVDAATATQAAWGAFLEF